jgi:hypothetical protein
MHDFQIHQVFKNNLPFFSLLFFSSLLFSPLLFLLFHLFLTSVNSALQINRIPTRQCHHRPDTGGGILALLLSILLGGCAMSG